jgi:hypothetical protein
MLWGPLLPAPESPHRISPRPLFTTPTSPAGIPAWHTARAQTKNANVAEKPLRISAMLASTQQITPVCLNTPLCESVSSLHYQYTLVPQISTSSLKRYITRRNSQRKGPKKNLNFNSPKFTWITALLWLRTQHNTRLPLYPSCLLLLVRLGGYIVNLFDFYSYNLIGKLTVFLNLQEFSFLNLPVSSSTSTARRSQTTLNQRLIWRLWQIGNILAEAASLRITLNIDGAPIESRSHNHPSHSQTSRLLTSSLSLGVPVPLATQCMWDV